MSQKKTRPLSKQQNTQFRSDIVIIVAVALLVAVLVLAVVFVDGDDDEVVDFTVFVIPGQLLVGRHSGSIICMI